MPDSLFDRMKKYEDVSQTRLTPRLPIILRVDGKAFHTYTKGMVDRPFNRMMIHVMEKTAIELCREIQGAELAYVQSDEISILINSYKNINSEAWFDNQVQKMVSVASGIASATFTANSWKIWATESATIFPDDIRPAYFDGRAFVMPESDVNNYFVWRQQDAIRNSISSHARLFFTQKECNGKNGLVLREMCETAGHSWDSRPKSQQRGRCIKKVIELETNRSHWFADTEIPIFHDDPEYVNTHLWKSPEV